MISYVENGASFSLPYGAGIRVSYREISKEEYDRLSALPKKDFQDEVIASLDDSILCGYGFYGCDVSIRDDKYYLIKRIGTSCD